MAAETDSDFSRVASPITRRRFLGGVGALTLTGAFAPALLARREDTPILLGSGEHTYRCRHDWLTPPADLLWGDTHGVAQDKSGRIYIAHTVHPDSPRKEAIVVFDASGKFITAWGAEFAGGAHGLDIRTENGVEYLYHCDIKNRRIVKTTLSGAKVWEIGAPEEAGVYKDGAPFVPTNVAFAPDGNDFYVGDGYGSHYIHRFTKNGGYGKTFGGPGDQPGQVQCPHGLWLDTRGSEPLLVVADRSNHRLQYFTPDGKHVRFVTTGMRQPCHFSIRGDLLLIPDLNSVVTLLDKSNQVVAQLGDGDPSPLRDAPRSQFIPGKFIHPHSAKFLQNGDILVVEWVPIGRVTLLQKVRT